MVAVAIDDPVQMGIAKTLARPGSRFTGVSAAFEGILARRLQLLADLVPAAPRRFAVLMNPTTIDPALVRDGLRALEPAPGPVQLLQASGLPDFDAAFNALARERVNGLVVVSDATFYTHRLDLGARCRAMKLPSVWGGRDYLEGGGLAPYQGDFAALYRRSAAMIDKILKGTPPGDIPFEQGTKFELVLNLRAAQALGLSVPARVRVSADALVE